MTREPDQPSIVFGPIGALTAQWRRGWAWLIPGWAFACGIFAAGGLSSAQIVPILVALIIAVGLWPAFWIALAETHWAAPLSRWRAWDKGEPLKSLPYAVPGSDADRLVIVLGKFRAWATEDLLPNHGNAILVSLCAPVVALILAAVLGAPAVGLTIVAICLPQLAVLVARGNGNANPVLRGMIEIALPLLLGYSLLRVIPIEGMVVAVGFAIAYAGATTGHTWTWNLGLAIVLAVLVVTRHSVGVFVVGLFWLPQFLAQAQPAPRRATWWLYASMLIAALTLG